MEQGRGTSATETEPEGHISVSSTRQTWRLPRLREGARKHTPHPHPPAPAVISHLKCCIKPVSPKREGLASLAANPRFHTVMLPSTTGPFSVGNLPHNHPRLAAAQDAGGRLMAEQSGAPVGAWVPARLTAP